MCVWMSMQSFMGPVYRRNEIRDRPRLTTIRRIFLPCLETVKPRKTWSVPDFAWLLACRRGRGRRSGWRRRRGFSRRRGRRRAGGRRRYSGGALGSRCPRRALVASGHRDLVALRVHALLITHVVALL